MNSNTPDIEGTQSQIEQHESSQEENTDSSQFIPPSRSATTNDLPEFGWSAYAERINGRFAMIGFLAVLTVEALSNDSFLHWAGLIR